MTSPANDPLADPVAKAAAKWAPFLNGAPPVGSSQLQKIIGAMTSTTKEVEVGPFMKFAFPLVLKTAPSFASNIVSVQPMSNPAGGINFYNPRYGKLRYGSEEDPVCVDDTVRTTVKIDDRFVIGTVKEVVKKDSFKNPKHYAVVEDAKTGRHHHVDIFGLEKASPLDALAEIPDSRVELSKKE
jgi:hypothetical protein